MLHPYGLTKIMKHQQEMLEKKMETAWMFTTHDPLQKSRQNLLFKFNSVLVYLRKRKGIT